MDNIHDLGGMHGFGPIPIETQNYTFKHDWQRRSFALAEALAGPVRFGADMHRYQIEMMPAAQYLETDYWSRWEIATKALVVKAGLAAEEEFATGQKLFDVDVIANPPVEADELVEIMKRGGDYAFAEDEFAARFEVGDNVQVRSDAPIGHTRVPRYVRARTGRIEAVEGVFQLADDVAKGEGPSPQHCYLVSFVASNLWGKDAESPNDLMLLNLAESYLEPA